MTMAGIPNKRTLQRVAKLLQRMSEAVDDCGPDEDVGASKHGLWIALATEGNQHE